MDKEQNGRIEAVIFDIDGTLVDSNHFHAHAWQRAFARYGKDIALTKIHPQIGKGGDQLMPVFLSTDELERFGKELEKYRGDLFRDEYLDRVRPFPGVRELFERIKADGIRIALASSASAAEVERHQETLGIIALVDAATSADDADSSKPSPDIFNAALDALGGITAKHVLVIGDSPWDMIAAQKAGMLRIAVLSGGFTDEELTRAGAGAIYSDPAGLLANYDASILSRARGSAANRAT